MKKFLRILFIVLISSTGIKAQELPPVQNFAPVDYAGENQNWAISQSSDKQIFVANNEGLLVYNGAEWTRYTSPNGSIMRSVYVDEGRVYTGCFMEFGYWQPDEIGVLQYTSLSQSIKNQLLEDEEFWTINKVNGYLLFQSLNRIYVYNTTSDDFTIIKSDNRIPKVFAIGNQVFFQKMGQGIFKIENGKELLLYDDNVVRRDEVVYLFEKDGNNILLTRNYGFYQMSEGSLEKWVTPDQSLFDKISIYSATLLEDGHLALGTIANGLMVLDESGGLVYQIDEIKGLRNNTVLALFQDIDHNLWLGLDNGVAYVNLKSPFRVFRDNRGVVGSVYAAAIKDDMLYLGSNQGLFYRKYTSQEDFQLIEGTQGQVWSLNIIDDTLFCGHHTGTFIINGDKATRILEVPGTWKISQIPGNEELLLQGNYDGLYVLSRSGNNWSLRNKIEGFNNSSRYFEIYKGDIFVNHEYKGVFKINVDDQYSNVREVRVDTSLISHNSGMVKYQDKLLYACSDGIYAYNSEKSNFVADSLLSQIYDSDSYLSGKLTVDNRIGHLWVVSKSNINYVSSDSFSNDPLINRIDLSETERNGVVGYESFIPLPSNGTYLFGTTDGYITFDINNINENPFQVNISSVKKGSRETDLSSVSGVSPQLKGEFEPDENHLQINFYAPIYNQLSKPQYQHRLTGIYADWSEWSETASSSYENLPYGTYEFQVRARVGDRISENVARYSFRIARPWYLSNLMITAYSIFAILFGLFIHRAYTLYYRKQHQKIEEDNKKELELIKLQNDREIIRIKNEQLKEDFKNKSNELAASTMSIIKKNELLTRVKEQLLETNETQRSVKDIVAIIDKNLKQSDDWELFKEAFNNTDREFLQKLESAHQNLTPNDIRLCAYLRLNLSSKEIAELFNISVRSVEIKRYRLRKKMNLSHDDNLVGYILKL